MRLTRISVLKVLSLIVMTIMIMLHCQRYERVIFIQIDYLIKHFHVAEEKNEKDGREKEEQGNN